MTSVPPTENIKTAVKRSMPALKFFGVCLLIMVLGIPTMIVGFLSSDRQSSARQAAGEISSQWGGGR
ncbi:MAG: inner membrane CreD family protein, partial [Aestuariivirgaceae bacterium]